MKRNAGLFLRSTAVAVLLTAAVGVSAARAGASGSSLTGLWNGMGFDRKGRTVCVTFNLVQDGSRISGDWSDAGCAGGDTSTGLLVGKTRVNSVQITALGVQAPDFPDCEITFKGIRQGDSEITGRWQETFASLCDGPDEGTLDFVRQE